MNHSSFRDIWNATPIEKRRTDSLWTRILLRPLSVVVTWLLMPLRVTANQVTYASILICLASGIALAIGGPKAGVSASAGFMLFAVLDCVDGNIARLRGGHPLGEWVDALGGYIAYTVVLLAAGYAAVRYTSGVVSGWPLMPAAAAGACANLLMRVCYQSYRNVTGPQGAEGVSRFRIISENLGITGLLMPAVLVGVLLGILGHVVLFYSAFFVLGSVVVIGRLAIKARPGKPG